MLRKTASTASNWGRNIFLMLPLNSWRNSDLLVGVQVSSQSYAAFRFATNPKRYLNWCCTMSLGVSWFWPSLDFHVLRCDAMKIWCCTASSFSDVSPWPAKMLSPSSPPPGPRLCWGPHPGHWTQCPAPGCGPGRPAGQGVKQSSPTIKC